ncbi:hypothetical protein [Enterovirga rhinocerotis]|uniref:hypothetical protein n=1 Tax=Enterovirga rhinocerotis TaxID=1339210 RepID=UPI0014150A1B|nr:hypothetical protein [Enterovirga rhinocerotis]
MPRPGRPPLSYWVRLDQLDFIRPVARNGAQTLALPLGRSCHAAFVSAVALA